MSTKTDAMVASGYNLQIAATTKTGETVTPSIAAGMGQAARITGLAYFIARRSTDSPYSMLDALRAIYREFDDTVCAQTFTR